MPTPLEVMRTIRRMTGRATQVHVPFEAAEAQRRRDAGKVVTS